jgi:hypothetical protein
MLEMQERLGGGTPMSHLRAQRPDGQLRGERFAFQFGDGWQGTFVQHEVRALIGAGTDKQGRCIGAGHASYRQEIALQCLS